MTRPLIDKAGEATELPNPVRGVVMIELETIQLIIVSGLAFGRVPSTRLAWGAASIAMCCTGVCHFGDRTGRFKVRIDRR